MAIWKVDADIVERMGHTVTEIIDCIVEGEATWDHLTEYLGTTIPGTFAVIMNQDAARLDANYFSSFNMAPEFAQSFQQYYSQFNPWNVNWGSMRSGDILVSEEMAPASLFRNTEFYEDWLRPQKGVDAGVGLQVIDRGVHRVYMTIHYSAAAHDVYGRALPQLYRQFRGHLKRAVRLAEIVSSTSADVGAEAAIVARSDRCAVVVDGEMKVKNANDLAVEEFLRGSFMINKSGQFALRDPKQQAAVASSVRALTSRKPPQFDQFYFHNGRDMWLVELSAVPQKSGTLAAVMPLQPLVVMIARNLKNSVSSGNFATFAQHFHLTNAELSLCLELVRGSPLNEAAATLGITYETARSRMKVIFDKVGVNRQADLILMMIR